MDVNAAGIYDPCVNEGKARFKKSFTIGLAYFPNGSIDDWGDLDPCDSSNRSTLTEKGVAISSFRVSVDEMTLLRTSRQDEDGLMETTTPSQATFLSVVAFARGVRSIPRVIRVKSTYPLLLTDFAGKHGRVSSLTLLARFDEGNLEDLQWENVGCGACGGINNLQCLHVGVNATYSRNANYACMLQEDSDCECLATASASAGTCAIAAWRLTPQAAEPLRARAAAPRITAHATRAAGLPLAAQDVQGFEVRLVPQTIDVLEAKVARLIVGTHTDRAQARS